MLKFRVWALLLRGSRDRRGSYLQHARTPGQTIQQQKLRHGRQVVLAVEKGMSQEWTIGCYLSNE